MNVRLPILILFAAACVAPTSADRGDDDDDGKRGRRPDHPSHGGSPFDDMTPEQRERVREALKQVWDDPAVEQARKDMGAAAAAYRESLREAIGRTDPEIRELLDKALRDKFRRQMRGHRGERDGFPGLPRVEDVPEPYRERLQAVLDVAARDTELKGIREKLEAGDLSEEERKRVFHLSIERLQSVVAREDPELLRFFRPPGRDENAGDGEKGEERGPPRRVIPPR
ncbi:hypothetical protein BH23VER1_BH23VER1_12580 [soil metagenome]